MSWTYTAEPVRAAPAVAAVVVVGAYVGGLSYAMQHSTYDVWGALIVVPLLVVASIPLLRRAIRIENDTWMAQLIVIAFALKLGGSLLRYIVAASAYGGTSDATAYGNAGERLARLWWHGQFTFDTGDKLVGTGFVKLVSAAVYSLSGPSIISGYLVFSWLGFWGLYFAYRAYRIALPDGNHRRYAALVFLLPSMLFWPSSMGKEALMTLCVGLIALGAAKLYARGRGGYPLLAAGLAGGAMIRPHVIVFAAAGVLVGYVLAPRKHPGPASAMWKTIGVVILSVASIVILHRAAGFLGLTAINSGQVTQALQSATLRTVEGGSSFTPHPVSSPLDFPQAFVTVLFRPFPWEAHNPQAIVASLESLLLLTLLATSWRSLARLPRMLTKRPYVALSTVYVVLFVYAFSAFGNFGILVRERVQVLPFFFVLVSLPFASSASRRAAATVEATSASHGRVRR